MGDFEACTPVCVESLLKYHSDRSGYLTLAHDLGWGQCLVGSLTGAVASQNVTEAPKGSLSLVGNQVQECKCTRELDCETYKSSRDESRD